MSAASRAGDLLRRAVRPADLTAARISLRLNSGPRYGVEWPRWVGRFCLALCAARATPIAFPASCGGAGRKMLENSPERLTTSLVTQWRATPPARHKFSDGTLRLTRRTSAMTAASVAD